MHTSPSRGVTKTRTGSVRGPLKGPFVSLRGISLVETLVAFAILAIGISILGQLTFWALNESVLSRRRAQAALLAQERMEDLVAHRSDLGAWEATARSGFEFDRDLGLYRFDQLQPEQKRPELAPFRWSWQITDIDGQPGVKKILVQLYVLRPGTKGTAPPRDLWTLLALPMNRQHQPTAGGTTAPEGAPQ